MALAMSQCSTTTIQELLHKDSSELDQEEQLSLIQRSLNSNDSSARRNEKFDLADVFIPDPVTLSFEKEAVSAEVVSGRSSLSILLNTTSPNADDDVFYDDGLDHRNCYGDRSAPNGAAGESRRNGHQRSASGQTDPSSNRHNRRRTLKRHSSMYNGKVPPPRPRGVDLDLRTDVAPAAAAAADGGGTTSARRNTDISSRKDIGNSRRRQQQPHQRPSSKSSATARKSRRVTNDNGHPDGRVSGKRGHAASEPPQPLVPPPPRRSVVRHQYRTHGSTRKPKPPTNHASARNPPRRKTAASNKVIAVTVFFPSAGDAPHKVRFSISRQCTVEGLLELACEHYTEQNLSPALVCDHFGMVLKIAEDDGSVDDDFPDLVRSQVVAEVGVVQFCVELSSQLSALTPSRNIPGGGLSSSPMSAHSLDGVVASSIERPGCFSCIFNRRRHRRGAAKALKSR